MNTPIKREDIRKGDKIRMSFEFIADSDLTRPGDNNVDTYELIERPVTLPTEPGWYMSAKGAFWSLEFKGEWRNSRDSAVTDDEARIFGPFRRVRPVDEVVAETFARAANFLESVDMTTTAKDLRDYAASWAAK